MCKVNPENGNIQLQFETHIFHTTPKNTAMNPRRYKLEHQFSSNADAIVKTN